MKQLLSGAAVLAILAVAQPAMAQAGSGDVVLEPAPDPIEAADGARVYTPADFERFAPRNALDMLSQVPGFTLRGEDGQRGFGQASANVLINGERITNKSDGVFTQLQRIATDRVVRIEIVEGASLGIAGLSGQVANVITRPSDISGRFTYRASARPRYAEPSFIGGEVSLSGSGDTLDWTVALGNGVGRGGAGGGESFIFDPDGNVLETRDVRQQFVGDFPRLSGNITWRAGGDTVVNANAAYGRVYSSFRDDQFRDLTIGVDRTRNFINVSRGYNYQLGADVEFDLMGGRLKLIALEQFSESRNTSDSVLVFIDDSPDTGSRFASVSDSGERIGRAEYSWSMLGGDWQWDVEAAFNRLDSTRQLFGLEPSGELIEIAFPNGSGGVTEDRYESILTQSRSLADNLSLQIGGGGEYSTISQTGETGLTRSFFRPKGSVNLAWQVEEGFDISLELARRVGQLSFGDFLASVSLNQDQQNAGNVELVPQQSWELELQAAKSLGEWGSTEIEFYIREIEDFIELIPVEGGLETRGNIDSASVWGIRWNSTFQLEPIGFNGAQLDLTLDFDRTSLVDPLTGEERRWSGNRNHEIEATLRHDIPGSNFAWGMGFEYNNALPNYRLGEVSLNYEGPTYTFAFIEHKDVFGMTANLTVFNLTDGRAVQDRLVFDGYRDRSPLLFRETQDLSVQPIFNFRLSGEF
ncbi:TonB-dependent receptor plug domain-containing protein [Aurantiacibacter sediminis]|uniref:TonB-dependent receptor plug domain-containing protein n=1 Tax=Aurantiacibacter sediminis TaxID=2793064 RepID=A0ABS0N6K4_9SPHN|nr:TonB-dependent receptor plug domain-containing protein [Aurantiacibacter sediminis]MBH5323398.1 TonB-dependent receptor plug domain-containing protein [Aurantiacibacter sediminis]